MKKFIVILSLACPLFLSATLVRAGDWSANKPVSLTNLPVSTKPSTVVSAKPNLPVYTKPPVVISTKPAYPVGIRANQPVNSKPGVWVSTTPNRPVSVKPNLPISTKLTVTGKPSKRVFVKTGSQPLTQQAQQTAQ